MGQTFGAICWSGKEAVKDVPSFDEDQRLRYETKRVYGLSKCYSMRRILYFLFFGTARASFYGTKVTSRI